jgi:hypothetical protein
MDSHCGFVSLASMAPAVAAGNNDGQHIPVNGATDGGV